MDRERIIEYLEGKIPKEEISLIKDWLKDQGNTEESRHILGEIWANSDIGLQGTKPDFDQLLNKLHHRINTSGLAKKTDAPGQRAIRKIYSYFSNAAAILIVPLIFAAIFFYLNQKPAQNYLSINEREIYTKPGTSTKLELSDGTVVWLNNGTIFRYPEIFDGNKREVFLDGEAYFEVKANPRKPFVVNNPIMKTVVTGTKFNLNAFSADSFFEATLKEGAIKLQRSNQRIRMSPGEQIQFDRINASITRKNVDPGISSSWIEGKLILKDEQFTAAMKKLSRWYNIDIEIKNPEINDYLITATLKDEKVEQTLDLISFAIPIKYTVAKNNGNMAKQKIILMKK